MVVVTNIEYTTEYNTKYTHYLESFDNHKSTSTKPNILQTKHLTKNMPSTFSVTVSQHLTYMCNQQQIVLNL